MTSTELRTYLKSILVFKTPKNKTQEELTFERLVKVFGLLPPDVAELFLTGKRVLTIRVLPDLQIPFGMRTEPSGKIYERNYTITIFNEHQSLPDDLFVGSVLRELGHVVAQRPPENEWPISRGERARFKEHLEHFADAMVWRWGLKHYSMRYLTATYPEHWVERIVKEISIILVEPANTIH
jgi:hypothetical protein